MGNYPGAQSPKPLIVLSNSPFISGLNNGPMTKPKRESFATKTTCAPAACNACLPTLGPAILPNCHQVYTTIPKARRDLLATRTLPPPSSCASDGLDWGIGRYMYIYQALDLNMLGFLPWDVYKFFTCTCWPSHLFSMCLCTSHVFFFSRVLVCYIFGAWVAEKEWRSITSLFKLNELLEPETTCSHYWIAWEMYGLRKIHSILSCSSKYTGAKLPN